MALGNFEQGEDSEGASFFGYLRLFVATFLIATFAVYCLLPKMRNIHGVILMCYLASMTVMYIFHAVLMFVRGSDMPTGLCPTIGKLKSKNLYLKRAEIFQILSTFSPMQLFLYISPISPLFLGSTFCAMEFGGCLGI